MSLKAKEGVDLSELHPTFLLHLVLYVEPIFAALLMHCVVTSAAKDSRHSRKSRHYVGLACDLRIWYVNKAGETIHLSEEEVYQLARAIRKALPPGYDVIIEDTHIHIEFDPKYEDIL